MRSRARPRAPSRACCSRAPGKSACASPSPPAPTCRASPPIRAACARCCSSSPTMRSNSPSAAWSISASSRARRGRPADSCASPSPTPAMGVAPEVARSLCSSLSRRATSPMRASSRARALALRWPSASSNRRAARSVLKAQPGEGAQFWFTLPAVRSGRHRRTQRRPCATAADARRHPGFRSCSLLRAPNVRAADRQSAGAVRQPRRRSPRARPMPIAPRRPRAVRRHHRRRRRCRHAGRGAGRAGADARGAAARRPRARRHRRSAALAGGGRMRFIARCSDLLRAARRNRSPTGTNECRAADRCVGLRRTGKIASGSRR